MPKITEEELLQNLDFKCDKCQAECQKTNALEPDVGYISKVDGSFVRLCKDCLKEIPEPERETRKVPETAFMVVVRPDGEGAILTTDGLPVPFRRDATFFDIINACNQVVRDLEEAIFASKLSNRLVTTMAMAQKNKPNLVIPR